MSENELLGKDWNTADFRIPCLLPRGYANIYWVNRVIKNNVKVEPKLYDLYNTERRPRSKYGEKGFKCWPCVQEHGNLVLSFTERVCQCGAHFQSILALIFKVL